jgi:uncharacterized protein with FMN-binding domain
MEVIAMTADGNVRVQGRRKRKSGLLILVIVLMIILAVLAAGAVTGWSALMREHREAASLPLNAVDFDALVDGVYHGAYAGGMYAWRRNECEVTVADGRVIDIQLVATEDPAAENMDYAMLYERVIEAQSLQVDTISGASLTSKAYLQCVENALLQEQAE